MVLLLFFVFFVKKRKTNVGQVKNIRCIDGVNGYNAFIGFVVVFCIHDDNIKIHLDMFLENVQVCESFSYELLF